MNILREESLINKKTIEFWLYHVIKYQDEYLIFEYHGQKGKPVLLFNKIHIVDNHFGIDEVIEQIYNFPEGRNIEDGSEFMQDEGRDYYKKLTRDAYEDIKGGMSPESITDVLKEITEQRMSLMKEQVGKFRNLVKVLNPYFEKIKKGEMTQEELVKRIKELQLGESFDENFDKNFDKFLKDVIKNTKQPKKSKPKPALPKVKCINAEGYEGILELNYEYDLVKMDEDMIVVLVNDDKKQFFAERFEKV